MEKFISGEINLIVILAFYLRKIVFFTTIILANTLEIKNKTKPALS